MVLKLESKNHGECYIFGYMLHIYRPQKKLRKGNVFTPICQSFCSRGGGACVAGGIMAGGDMYGGEGGLGWQRACVMRACVAGGGVRGRRDALCNGQYASYWNAFSSVSCFSVIEISFLTAGQFLII